MDVIKTVTNEKIKQLKKLHQKKYRLINKQFLVETKHLIEEAKKQDLLEMVITTDLFYSDDDIKVIYVEEHIMKHLSLLTSPPAYLGVVKFFESEISYQEDIVVLENIQNPGNLGTILRNALAFNLKNIILSNDCVDVYNEKVIQASQGAIFHLNIIKSDVDQAIERLKQHDYLLCGSSLKNAQNLEYETAFKQSKQNIALFFGNEGQGLSDKTLDQMDLNYYIEINNIDSLNVMSASAIFFYILSQKK